MTKTHSQKSRRRAELVEGLRMLNRHGAVSDADLEKTTIAMLGRDALPRIEPMAPEEIAALRERAGVSQSVLAAHLNVAVKTVSQWERGERHPTGAALTASGTDSTTLRGCPPSCQTWFVVAAALRSAAR